MIKKGKFQKYTTIDGDMITGGEKNSDFKVYVNKTVDEVLEINNISNPTWTEPLTEI